MKPKRVIRDAGNDDRQKRNVKNLPIPMNGPCPPPPYANKKARVKARKK